MAMTGTVAQVAAAEVVDGDAQPLAAAATVKEQPLCDGATTGEASYYKVGLKKKMDVLGKIALGVTSFFLVWFAVDTDANEAELADSGPVFQIAANIFVIFFFVEAGIRFHALEGKSNILRCPGLLWDLFLAISLALAVWVSPIMMGVNLLWVLQLLRAMRVATSDHVLELRILSVGIITAMRSVLFCVMLHLLNIYVFAMALCKLTRDKDVGQKHFETVASGMFTLLSRGVFLDGTSLMFAELKEQGVGLMYVFLVFEVLAFTLLVITGGVICEVVSEVAKVEKDRMVTNFLADALRKTLGSETAISECLMSQEAFVRLVSVPGGELAFLLKHLQIDAAELVTFADLIFAAKPFSSLEELAEELVQFDNRPATQRGLFRLEDRLRKLRSMQS